jgi:hypothetical protein
MKMIAMRGGGIGVWPRGKRKNNIDRPRRFEIGSFLGSVDLRS